MIGDNVIAWILRAVSFVLLLGVYYFIGNSEEEIKYHNKIALILFILAFSLGLLAQFISPHYSGDIP